ncbi:MAG: sodium:proton antiporter [Bacteroidaceae bacterium]|nr:sodium:proton antiporter [Bacteroidaceae bacterium]
MTIAILSLIIIGYILIATEHRTHINKATIAMFTGVVCWILFMSVGSDYVMKVHGQDFVEWSGGAASTSLLVKQYIASNVFIRYGAAICGIVLYLLATMNIVSVLNTNNCFDFITQLLRTPNSKQLLWILVTATFLISANLDNLTTTMLMLMIMRKVVAETRLRMWLGSAIVIAANCGGAFTVIGDVTSLVVWTKGAVTPTDFSAALVIPSIIATVVPTLLISFALPERVALVRPTSIYRGDAYSLPLWQRAVLLVIGIGGLWFIPTFHRITLLPPFLGALCVLGVLWVLHEIFNHRYITTEQPTEVSGDRQFQFASLQMIMYFVGVFLSVCVLVETGVMTSISAWCDQWIHNIYIMSIAIGCISSVLDNIALVLTAINIYPVLETPALAGSALSPDYLQNFLINGSYWYLIAYSGCVAGCLLPIGNLPGYMLMKAENVGITWYARRILPKVLIGWLLGLGAYFIFDLLDFIMHF